MTTFIIYPKQHAQVAARLIARGVQPNDPQLGIHIRDTLGMVLDSDRTDERADLEDIDLPDLDTPDTQTDVILDNVKALSAIYFASTLEDLKLFAVVDKIVEQFVQGMLPVTRGFGGEKLYSYLRTSDQRMTEVERRGLYARTLGVASGSVDEPMPNGEFSDLWIRFLSAVNVFARELDITGTPPTVTAPQVAKNAKDLAVNLSLHGYGIGHFAAVELQDTIKSLLDIVNDPAVVQAYSANDGWQVVERVSQLFLGGSVNGVRQRTMAQSGSRIIGWLADNAKTLAGADASGLFETRDDPNGVFWPLSTEVDRWLAVTGTNDQSTQRYSEPVSVSVQPTIPPLIPPSSATDALKAAMAKLPSLGVGGGNGVAIPKA